MIMLKDLEITNLESYTEIQEFAYDGDDYVSLED